MACGEGYGADVLARARRAASSASTPTPRPTSTRGCATGAPTCASSATSSRRFARAVRRDRRSCRRSSTSRTPGEVLEHFTALLRPGGTAYVSTPNVLTLAPEGAERSGNPWHVHEYRAEEFRALCARALRARRAARPLPRAQAARPRAGAARWAGTPCTRALRPHRALLRLLHAGDLRARLRAARRGAGARWTARWTSSPSAGREPRGGRRARARPAHPHALRRGLRHVAVRRGVAVGGDRRRATCRCSTCSSERRAGHAVADAGAVRPARGARASRRALPGLPARRARARRTRSTSPGCARAASDDLAAELERAGGDYARAAERFEALGGDLLGALRPARRVDLRGHARGAAAAGHRRGRAPAGRRPGIEAHRARFGDAGAAASGCPSARTRRGSTRCSRRPACTRPAST